jgi:hypothetical protein
MIHALVALDDMDQSLARSSVVALIRDNGKVCEPLIHGSLFKRSLQRCGRVSFFVVYTNGI